ncbi:MAG: outer membrane protein assembly factor BamD [Cyclobacteriaceae bacterium]
MLKSITKYTLLICSTVLIFGCTEFQKIRKSDDAFKKYEAAVAYYEEKDWYRSATLLEEILPVLRGTKEAELANFYFAYAHYNQDQFILSSHYFKTFYEVYSRSEYAMEAHYMHAYSLYMQSPKPQLDQIATYEAIAEMQGFINKYPYSDYAAEADKLIDELQVKLETKAFENAKLYYQIKRYEAAIVAFENFMLDFPDSRYNEEVMFLSVKTYYDYAEVSITTKQKERYQKAVDFYEKLVDKWPNSNFLKQAEGLYSNSLKEITKFASAK